MSQDYFNWELLITDNASDDESRTIINEYVKQDSRIHYFRNKINIGAIANFNRVFELSSGKYFMWASGHDLRTTSVLSQCVNKLEEDSSVVLAYPVTAHVNEAGEVLEVRGQFDTTNHRIDDPVGRLMYFLWSYSPPDIIYGVMKSDALRRVGPAKPVPGTDYVMLIRLSLVGRFAQVKDQFLYSKVNRTETPENQMTRYREQFFSSESRPARWSPMWRMVWECFRSVSTAGLVFKQRVAIAFGLLMWLGRLRGSLLREIIGKTVTKKTAVTSKKPLAST